MNNPSTAHYEILQPITWFGVGQRVPVDEFLKYYTPFAVQALLKYDFIKIHLK